MKGLLIVITVAALATMIAAGQAMAQATTTPPPATGSQVAPGAGTPAPGGKAEGCGHWRHGRGVRLGQLLGLTDDQKAQIKTIMTAAREQAKTAADRAAKVKIFRDAFEKVKTTVLTDAQRQKLADLKAQWKANHPAGPAAAKPATAAPAAA